MSRFQKYLKKTSVEQEIPEVKNKEIITESQDIVSLLRKEYKFKNTINTLFGIQIDFFQKPELEDLKKIIQSDFKVKDKSIFIFY